MGVETLDSQKRKLEEETDASGDAAMVKRAAGDASGPAPMEVERPPLLMKNEDFNADLLRIYYDRLFPFHQMFRWLSYKNDPKSGRASERDYFLRREFTLVLAGDIFCRYTCFKDAEEYRAQVLARQPVRMEIGAVYTHPPKNHNTVIKEAYKPLERELVFDIDMDDYDDIRTCCTGAKLCPKCWVFMKCAIKQLNRALREDFGFKHIMFVYSGRRGVHCWVCDKAARKLQNDHRSAVADYLSLVATGAGKCQADLRFNGCDELHPSILEAHKIGLSYFRDDPDGILEGQDILRKGPHLPSILETMSVSEREVMSKYVNDHPNATSRSIWNELEKLAAERARTASSYKQKQEAQVMLKSVVIQYTAPRLDVNVSKQMNHLLKSPFVVHPKTGRVCVPINPDDADNFNPLEVPTIGRLVEELDRTGDVRQTSLKPYTHWFEVEFLQVLEREIVKERQREGDMEF